MTRKYVRHPKRVTRRAGEFTEPEFVRAAQSSVSFLQSAVQRVGNSIIGGDFGGNARGLRAIDIQITRGEPYDAALVASDGRMRNAVCGKGRTQEARNKTQDTGRRDVGAQGKG